MTWPGHVTKSGVIWRAPNSIWAPELETADGAAKTELEVAAAAGPARMRCPSGNPFVGFGELAHGHGRRADERRVGGQ